jgi:hypothetical protein
MQRPEIHVIYLQRHPRRIVFRLPHAQYRTLAVNALLSKTMVGGQFDLDRQDIAGRREWKREILGMPDDQNSAAADIFRGQRAVRPNAWRGNMTSKLDLDPRALAPVDNSHFYAATTPANLALLRTPINIVNGYATLVAMVIRE